MTIERASIHYAGQRRGPTPALWLEVSPIGCNTIGVKDKGESLGGVCGLVLWYSDFLHLPKLVEELLQLLLAALMLQREV